MASFQNNIYHEKDDIRWVRACAAPGNWSLLFVVGSTGLKHPSLSNISGFALTSTTAETAHLLLLFGLWPQIPQKSSFLGAPPFQIEASLCHAKQLPFLLFVFDDKNPDRFFGDCAGTWRPSSSVANLICAWWWSWATSCPPLPTSSWHTGVCARSAWEVTHTHTHTPNLSTCCRCWGSSFL